MTEPRYTLVCVPASLTVQACLDAAGLHNKFPFLMIEVSGPDGTTWKELGQLHSDTLLSQVVEGVRLYHDHDGLDLILMALKQA